MSEFPISVILFFRRSQKMFPCVQIQVEIPAKQMSKKVSSFFSVGNSAVNLFTNRKYKQL